MGMVHIKFYGTFIDNLIVTQLNNLNQFDEFFSLDFGIS